MTFLSATYTGQGGQPSPRLSLEPEPVADGSLSATDLEQMLALVRAGISAKLYRPADCPASVVDGAVVVGLDLWVWPVPLALDYHLAASLGTVGDPIAVRVEREFDVVVNFNQRVDLPFVAEAITWTWADMGCFDRQSNRVEPPTVMVESGALVLSAAVVGVLRVRCVAVGALHTVRLALAKGTNRISDIRPTVTAEWKGPTSTLAESVDLTLPGCVELLLATCEDDLLVERRYGSVREEEQTVPVVYYSDCDGTELAVRYEHP